MGLCDEVARTASSSIQLQSEKEKVKGLLESMLLGWLGVGRGLGDIKEMGALTKTGELRI